MAEKEQKPKNKQEDKEKDAEIKKMQEAFETEMRKMLEDLQKFQADMIKAFEAKQKQAKESKESKEPTNAKRVSITCEPLIRQEGDKKIMQMKFDVSPFKKEEVEVKTEGNKLIIRAKHEEDFGHGKLNSVFIQVIQLPDNVDPKTIKTNIDKDGVLSVDGVLSPTKEKEKQKETEKGKEQVKEKAKIKT